MTWRRPAAFGILLTAMTCAQAGAHPLGNFTINHLAVLRPSGNGLSIRYVLDIAEIPSFQIMHAAPWTPERVRSWTAEEANRVSGGLSIRANGAAQPLVLRRAYATTRPGAGGLPTLYWTGDYSVALPQAASVVVEDSVYAERRIGWKDIALAGHPDVTRELRAYPNALLGSPRHNDRATFRYVDGRLANAGVSGEELPSWGAASLARTSLLSDLFSRDAAAPALAVLTVLAAFGLGALHGLEPGHGKAILAFTLVGARATFRQALILAGALTFAHTVAVFLLGLLLFVAAGFATETVFTWITLVSGVAIAAIGAKSLVAAIVRLTKRRSHDHPHAHPHEMPGSAPLHFPSAVVAAMSGGIAPCPAAIVVLLTALHAHRTGYGMFLIFVFSLGLASVLAGLGFAVVRGAAWLQRQAVFSRLARFAPAATGIVIVSIGATMIAQGLSDRGIALPVASVLAITLFIAAIFALIPRQRSREIRAA